MLPVVCVLETKAMLMIFRILRILRGVISTNSSQHKSSMQLKGAVRDPVSPVSHADGHGDEPKSQACGLSVPTVLHHRRGGSITAGTSNASQIYLFIALGESS